MVRLNQQATRATFQRVASIRGGVCAALLFAVSSLTPAARVDGQSTTPPVPSDNFIFVASEELAIRIVARTEITNRPVVDYVLGARVRGASTSTTNVCLNFRPSPHSALIYFCLRTEIQSDTVGVTKITQTRTLGRHSLLAAKPIFFDANIVSTRKPEAAVVPRNQTAGVRTPVSGVPLLGPAFDQFIFSEAQKRRPQSERIAAGRVLDEAVPEFNSSIDSELAKLNIGLAQTVHPTLDRWKLVPDHQIASTTDHHLLYSARLTPNAAAPIGSLPESYHAPAALVVAVHESLLNGAVDRQKFGGVEVSDTQLDRWVARFSNAMERDTGVTPDDSTNDADANKPKLATLKFDDVDPVRFHIEDARLILTVKLGIQPVLGNPIAAQPISIPLKPSIRDGEIHIEPGKVTVGTADADDAGQVAELVRGLIKQQVESRLKSLKFGAQFNIPAGDSKTVPIAITEIKATNGWLVLKLN